MGNAAFSCIDATEAIPSDSYDTVVLVLVKKKCKKRGAGGLTF